MYNSREELSEEEKKKNQLAENAKVESALVKRQVKDKADLLEKDKQIELAKQNYDKNRVRRLQQEKKELREMTAERDIHINRIREQAKAEIEGQKKVAAALDKKSKALQKTGDVLRKLPGVGSALSDSLSASARAMAKTGKATDAAKAGLTSIGKLVGPTAILGNIIEISDQVGGLSKDLGVSFEAARGMREHFADIADKSNSSRINSKRLMEANQALNQSLGLTTLHSDEANESFIQTTKYLGASAAAAGRLEGISLATGVSAESLKDSLAEQAISAGKNYGIQVSLKEVVEGIKNIQGATLAYIADQPAELMRAVAVSKKLGMSFAEIRGIADGMLDFQSSITNEVEAEVLLGRDINLNKARQLAFLGKEAELGEEVLKQAGSLSDYKKMLPVQQEAFAKSLGMTRDKMAEVLMKQEAINKYGEQARDLSEEQIRNAERLAKKRGISVGEQLKEEAQRATATQNFQDAADKLKGTFQDIFIKVEPLITKLAKMFSDFVGSSLGRSTMIAAGSVALLAKAFSATKGTALNPMVVRQAGMGGTGRTGRMGRMASRIGSKLPGGSRYGAAMRASRMGKFGLSRGMGGAMGIKGVGLGAVASVAGMAVDHYADKAVENKNEDKAVALGATAKALQYGGMGAMIGSVIPVVGTAVGAAVGASVGAVVGAIEKKEAVREKKKEDYLKEKAEQSELVREIKMMRQAVADSESQVVLDGQTLGTIQANRPYNDMNKPVLS